MGLKIEDLTESRTFLKVFNFPISRMTYSLTHYKNLSPSLLGLSVVSGLASLMSVVPAQAQTAVCTPAFTSSVSQGSIISAVQTGAIPPCSASLATVSINVGTGGNAGVVFTGDFIIGNATRRFTRTSVSSVAIASPASTSTPFTLNFSLPVQDPYLFFTYLDPNTSFIFSEPINLADGTEAMWDGDKTIIAAGVPSNRQDDGFVIYFEGVYSTLGFTYKNDASFANSVAFTSGGTPVPGPLPLLGVGAMLQFSRKLRRRIQA